MVFTTVLSPEPRGSGSRLEAGNTLGLNKGRQSQETELLTEIVSKAEGEERKTCPPPSSSC